MKCYNHPATDSVGTCNGCNKGLCKECASVFNVPLCKPCYVAEKQSNVREVYGIFAFTLLFAGVGLLITIMMSNATQTAGGASIVMFFLFPIFTGLSYLSWRFVSRTIGFLASKSATWIVDLKYYIMYLWAKLLISVAISIVAGPLELIYVIRKWRIAKTEIVSVANVQG